MKNSWTLMAGLAAALTLVSVLAWAPAVTAHAEEDDDDATIESVVEALGKAKIGLADAIRIAVAKTGGKAVAAGFELEDETAIFEVLLYVAGDDAHFVEVEIDAASGKILEIEREDMDDDEEEGDVDEEGDEHDED